MDGGGMKFIKGGKETRGEMDDKRRSKRKKGKIEKEQGDKNVKRGRKSSGTNRQEVIQKAGSRRVRVAVSNDSFSLDDSRMTNLLQPFCTFA